MSESAPPQEQDERLWDVHCSFCGDVSRAWKRPELAVFELKDHIAYHVQGITIDAHVPSAPPQEPQEQERAEWTEADLGTMQSALTLLEDAYAPCDADCECILHPLRSLVSRLPTLPAPPPPPEVEDEPRDRFGQVLNPMCACGHRWGRHSASAWRDNCRECSCCAFTTPSQSTGDASMSVDEAWERHAAIVPPAIRRKIEAAIRDETRAPLEARLDHVVETYDHNVRLFRARTEAAEAQVAALAGVLGYRQRYIHGEEGHRAQFVDCDETECVEVHKLTIRALSGGASQGGGSDVGSR